MSARPICRRLTAIALAMAVAMAPTVTRAVQPDEVLADPKLEQRARDISADLRCLVCQNQSIDDSDAPLARDLRLLVREQLQTGKSDAQVRDFLVARYGDFILLRPPFKTETLLLWTLPFLAALGGAVAIVASARRRRAAAAAPLSPDERQRLQALLDDPK